MLDQLTSLLVTALLVTLGLSLFWPERGLLSRWQHTRRMTDRVLTEDTLKHINNCAMAGDRPTIQSIAGVLQINPAKVSDLVSKMEAGNLVQLEKGTLQLTPTGRESALHILRAHRIWEQYLADETGFAESEWHLQADYFEHHLSPAEVEALSAQLGHPTHDPHGDPIPTADGELVDHQGTHLTAVDIDVPVRIVHIEDEPPTVYAQLVAEGLHINMQVRVIEKSPQRFRFWANGDEHVLAPIVANNITVVPMLEEQEISIGIRLSSLKPDQKGKVLGISPACRGQERRRLMDLGLLQGTVVKAEYTSPSGDPTAYRIRDAVIALRKEQANNIHIIRLEEDVA